MHVPTGVWWPISGCIFSVLLFSCRLGFMATYNVLNMMANLLSEAKPSVPVARGESRRNVMKVQQNIIYQTENNIWFAVAFNNAQFDMSVQQYRTTVQQYSAVQQVIRFCGLLQGFSDNNPNIAIPFVFNTPASYISITDKCNNVPINYFSFHSSNIPASLASSVCKISNICSLS